MIIKQNNTGMSSICFINQGVILKHGLYPHLTTAVNSEDTDFY